MKSETMKGGNYDCIKLREMESQRGPMVREETALPQGLHLDAVGHDQMEVLEVSECKSCGAQIVWIKTVAGKSIPCCAKERTVVTKGGVIVKGHESHFADCPQANDWRQR